MRCGRIDGVALAVDGCWHTSSGAATRTADSSVGAGSGSSAAYAVRGQCGFWLGGGNSRGTVTTTRGRMGRTRGLVGGAGGRGFGDASIVLARLPRAVKLGGEVGERGRGGGGRGLFGAPSEGARRGAMPGGVR